MSIAPSDIASAKKTACIRTDKIIASIGKSNFLKLSNAASNKNTSSLRVYFEKALSDCKVGLQNSLENLLDARIAIEIASCLCVGECDEDTVDDFVQILEEINESLKLSAHGPLTQENLEKFWDYDYLFHEKITEFGNLPNSRIFLDALHSTSVKYGLPSTRFEMREIYEEHCGIINAIKSKVESNISVAIDCHIGLASARWIELNRTESNGMTHRPRPELQKITGEAVHQRELEYGRPLTQYESDCIGWEIEFEHDYHEKTVVFNVFNRVAEGVCRQVREVLFSHSDEAEICSFTEFIPIAKMKNMRVLRYPIFD